MLAARTASAGEGPFGWIYTLDLQPQNTAQVQQWLWLQEGQSQGDYHFVTARTEVEYGVTPWYQIGGYLNLSYANAKANGIDGLTGGPGVRIPENMPTTRRYEKARFEGVSMENVVRLMNPYTDGFGLGLYFEPSVGPDEQELEFKILGQKNFFDDRLVLAANAVFESEWENKAGGETEHASVLDLLLGASYRFAPSWFAGVEFRNHREFMGNFYDAAEHSAYFLGPTIHYAAQKWWATLGWRHQLPIVKAFNDDQRAVVQDGRIFGGEHARDEIMLRIGVPL